MPAATMAWVAPSVLAAVGIHQQGQQAKKQQDAIKKAQQAGKWTEAAQGDMYNLAKSYDPEKEAQSSIDYANASAGETLKRNLSALRGDFVQSGGDPAGDTEFNVRAQTEATRVMDPLRDFLAKVKSNATMQKLGALQSVTNVPVGQIAQGYWQSANQMQPDYSGPVTMFSQALRGLFNNKGGGAGGSGDWRDNSKTQEGGWNA